MSVKTYHCYDRLYYMKDEDCNFEGEVYSESTTVGYILNKLTSKYPDIKTLSDDYKGDFAPYWNDVLQKPIKYENYVAPPEKDPENELMPDPITPIEDHFPTSSGSSPAINPGACCDCDHSGGGTKPEGPKPPEGSTDEMIIVTDRTPLFMDREWDEFGDTDVSSSDREMALWVSVQPEDTTSSNSGTEGHRFNSDIKVVAEVISGKDVASIEPFSYDRGYRIFPKKPGNFTVQATATLLDGATRTDVKTINIPDITKEGLMQKYWGSNCLVNGKSSSDPKIYASDLSGWDITDTSGGGKFKKGKCICTQTYELVSDSDGRPHAYAVINGKRVKSLDIAHSDYDYGFDSPTYSRNYLYFFLPCCHSFDANYAVIKIENERIWDGVDSITPSLHGIPGSDDSSIIVGGNGRSNDIPEIKLKEPYNYDEGMIYHHQICIPNYFITDKNYNRTFDYANIPDIDTQGARSDANFMLYFNRENSNTILEEITDGNVILTIKIEFYGTDSLTEMEYKYLTAPPVVSTGSIYNSCSRPHMQGMNNNDSGASYNIKHAGSCCTNKKSWAPYYEVIRHAQGFHTLIDPTTENEFLYEDLMWNFENDRYSNVVTTSNDVTEIASYSLMSRSAELSSPSYDAQNNLIATYNTTEETDPNDPYETPNENNQVRSKKKEEIGFEMKESQLLGYIAAYCGGNAILDHENELRLVKLSKGVDSEGKQLYDKHIRLSEVGFPDIHNCEASSQLGGMTIRISKYEGDDIVLGDMQPTETKYVMDLDNPFMTKERATAIFNEMKDVIYKPMRVVVLSDPRLWLGDMVHFDGYSQRNETTDIDIEIIREGLYPIMKLISHYDGAPSLDIESTSSKHSDRTNSYSGTLSDKVDEVSNKVDTVEKDVDKFSGQIDELRTLVAYINELFAIEVNADNIVSATVNTRNIRIAPTSGDNSGVYIDGDSIDFIGGDGTQKLHIGSEGNPNDYFIRFVNENGYTRELRALDPDKGCSTNTSDDNLNDGDNDLDDNLTVVNEVNDVNATILSLEARIAELEKKLNESEGE